MPQTPRLGLPLIAAGQSQKDVTHNEALLALDRLVTLVVMSDSEAVPPAEPVDGAVWIVPVAGATAWGHAAGTLMHWQAAADSGQWIAAAPRDGQLAFVTATGLLIVHAGGWQIVRRVEAPEVLALPSGGSTVDAEARTALSALVLVLQRQGFVT